MKRLMTLGMAMAAAVVPAACGGSAGTSGAGGSGAGSGKTVTVAHLPGVGSVLVDRSDKALYSSDLEAGGKIVCDDAACNAFWRPLIVRSGKPTASAGAGKVGVIKRPDGSSQVSVNGRPVYTFAEDSPGNATGDGFHDDFAGHHFTWHVVHAGGITTSRAESGSGSTSKSTSGSSGGYG